MILLQILAIGVLAILALTFLYATVAGLWLAYGAFDSMRAYDKGSVMRSRYRSDVIADLAASMAFAGFAVLMALAAIELTRQSW